MIRRAHIHRQALLWNNPNSHVNARCLRAAFTTLARSCTGAKPELAAAALEHLRRFVKPSLGGKAFKSEPPTVFFPLDPKKRHHQWATWSIFGSSEDLWWPFRRSEKAPPRITKLAELRLCRFSGPSRAGIVFDAGKSKVREVPRACLGTLTD